MKSRTLAAAALAFALPLVGLLSPSLATGDTPQHASTKGAPSTEFMSSVAMGNAKYRAKDFAAAVVLYAKAIGATPSDAMAPYLLGETHLAAGRLADAEAAWTKARAMSLGAGAEPLHLKTLFVLADLAERQRRWDDARTAWQAYAEFAAKNPTLAFPQSAAARIQAIDAMAKQDKAYEVVRQRIKEDRDGGAPP